MNSRKEGEGVSHIVTQEHKAAAISERQKGEKGHKMTKFA